MRKNRVVIVGGGFGGMYTALEFEKQRDPDFEVTLISQDNFFLFTPMLHEVAASDLLCAPGTVSTVAQSYVNSGYRLLGESEIQNLTTEPMRSQVLAYGQRIGAALVTKVLWWLANRISRRLCCVFLLHLTPHRFNSGFKIPQLCKVDSSSRVYHYLTMRPFLLPTCLSFSYRLWRYQLAVGDWLLHFGTIAGVHVRSTRWRKRLSAG